MSMILRYAKHLRRLNGVGWRTVLNQPQIEVTGVKLGYYQTHLTDFTSNKSYATAPAIKQEYSQNAYPMPPVQSLETRAKRFGRVAKSEILKALTEIQHSGTISSLDALFLIRCCGRLFVEGSNAESYQVVQEIWDTCTRLNVPMDVSHYNALLNVYLEKDHVFSPSTFIATMLEKSVEPNRVTYQRLIAAYCKQGDIAGATKILEIMKEKDMPLCESIFNSLIMGHSQANDLESATKIMETMKSAGVLPSTDTYEALMCAYAKHGDVKSIETTLEQLRNEDQVSLGSELLEVFYTLAAHGHVDEAGKFAEKYLRRVGIDSEIGRILVKLVNIQQIPLAIKLLTITTPDQARQTARSTYIIKAAIKNEQISDDNLIEICKELTASGYCDDSFRSAVYHGFKYNCEPKTLISLLKAWRDQGGEIRVHYFWPIFRSYTKQHSYEGVIELIKTMRNDFQLIPCVTTLRDYVIPYVFGTWQDAIAVLQNLNIPEESIRFAILERLLVEKKMKNAGMFMTSFPMKYPKEIFLEPLVNAFVTLKHVEPFVKALRLLDRDPNANGCDKTPTELIDAAVLKTIESLPYYATSHLIVLLNEFLNQGLTISPEVGDAATVFLKDKLTPEVSEMIAKLTSGTLTQIPISESDAPNYVGRNVNVPQMSTIELRRLFNNYLLAGDTQKILDVLESMDKINYISPSAVAQALSHFCDHGNIEAAKNCVTRMKEWDRKLDHIKIIKYVTLLVQNGQFNDAITYLSEVPELDETSRKSLLLKQQIRELFDKAEAVQDVENLRKLAKLLESKKFVENEKFMPTHLIRIHVNRNDWESALNEFERVCNEYKCTPLKTLLTKRFIELENASALQKITDLCTEIHGEFNSLSDLAFTFLGCDRPRQAQKILETPGIQIRNDRISSAIAWYRENGFTKALEQLPKVTKDVLKMDRGFMFDRLLALYDESNDWERGLGLWTEMQEMDCQPSQEFLPRLRSLLERNGQNVPFFVGDSDPRENLSRIISKTEFRTSTEGTKRDEVYKRLKELLSRQDYDSAKELIDSQEGPKSEKPQMYDGMIKSLLDNDNVSEAMDLARQVQRDCGHLNRKLLLQMAMKIKNEADYKKFVALGELLEPSMKEYVHYTKALAIIDIQMNGLKHFLENTNMNPPEINPREMEKNIHFGGIVRGLLADPSALPLLEEKAHILMKHGMDRLWHALWNYYLIKGSPEAAELWDQFIKTSSSPLVMPLIDYAFDNKDPTLVEHVRQLTENENHVSLHTKMIVFAGLMKIYNSLEKYEESLKVFQSASARFRPNRWLYSEMKKLRAGLQNSQVTNSSEKIQELNEANRKIEYENSNEATSRSENVV